MENFIPIIIILGIISLLVWAWIRGGKYKEPNVQTNQPKMGGGLRFLIIVGLIAFVIWLIYGTLNPCGMLKKEIYNEAKKSNDQGLLFLFGGIVDNVIDSLSPIQCIEGIVKYKLGDKTAINKLLGF